MKILRGIGGAKRVREIGLWSGWFTKDIDSQRYPLVRLDRDEVVDGGVRKGKEEEENGDGSVVRRRLDRG